MLRYAGPRFAVGLLLSSWRGQDEPEKQCIDRELMHEADSQPV